MSVGAEGIQSYSFNEITLSPGYDVQIEQEDGLSRNPAVRITQALDLLNAGVFTDMTTGVPDIKQFMLHAKINLPTAGYNMEATERAAASEVPYLMEKGQQHVPQLADDPAIFSEELLGCAGQGEGLTRCSGSKSVKSGSFILSGLLPVDLLRLLAGWRAVLKVVPVEAVLR